MKKIDVTTQLLQQFRQHPQTLIFEGYCKNAKDAVTVFGDGTSFALLAKFQQRTDCCVFNPTAEFLQQLQGELVGNVKFCGVDEFTLNFFAQNHNFLWRTDCFLCVWDGKPLPYTCKLEPKPITAEHAQAISDGTPYKADLDDVVDCVTNRISSAVYVDGQPVCWCVLHLENSLGMLYTLPQHRHKGYALEVMTDLCNKVIAEGNVPYAYIIQDNIASLNLGKKYNLTSVGNAYYFEIDFGSQK